MALRLTKYLVALVCALGLAVAVPLALGTTRAASGVPGNAAAGRALFIADCGECHTFQAAGSHGALGPNLDSDKLTLTQVITAVSEGVGGILADYTISTACIANPSGHKCLTSNQLYDIAKFIVTDRKGGPSLTP